MNISIDLIYNTELHFHLSNLTCTNLHPDLLNQQTPSLTPFDHNGLPFGWKFETNKQTGMSTL